MTDKREVERGEGGCGGTKLSILNFMGGRQTCMLKGSR
jgi:hypothetical protein